MTEEDFAALAREEGYGPSKAVTFDPRAKRDMHSHEETLLVYVRRGEFILNTEEGTHSFSPGETCLVAQGVRHAEEAGPEGAEILAVRK